jgi:nicotinate-nucleotide adenylyltransferase
MPTLPPRTALYGGAFNPPTLGHLAVVRRLLRAGFDRVLVMPCHGHTFGKALAPAPDRLALARACFADLPGAVVSSFEIDARLGGSTYELLQRLRCDPDHAETEFFVVIGSDEANLLHRWARADELREEARFVIIPRRGHALDQRAAWAYDPRHQILEDDGSLPEAASTDARAALHAGDAEAARRLLPESVFAEIHARRLYTPQIHPEFAHS